MPKLSVIIPVYNVQGYLQECVESILGQDYENIEILLIDDGSTDLSGQMIDSFLHDSRVITIHQTNKGVSAARNNCLKLATGDYYSFIDPDDFVDGNMFSSMVDRLEETACDLAICGFKYCRDDGTHIREDSLPEGVFDRKDLISSMYGMPNVFHGSMCNKVFKKEVIQGLRFDEKVAIGEDWLILYEVYLRAKRAAAMRDCFYTVRIRDHSSTRTKKAQLYVEKVKTYLRLYEYAGNQSKEVQKQAAEKILDTCVANKEEIKRYEYNRKCIAYINTCMRRISVESFFKGNLPVKRAIYYFIEGHKY